MADYKNYKFGQGGVNVDASPLHGQDDQLLKAQNLIRDRLGVDGGVKNRPGLVKFNSGAGSGSMAGGISTPAFQLIDTRTLYIAQQTGASAENWYTSSNLFGANAVTTALAAWQDPTAYCSTIGNVARMGAFLNGQVYYAGADYTSGTTSPSIRVFNGTDDRELGRILPATTFGIIAIHVSKGKLFVLTLDSGTSDADWSGRCFQLDPNTGHLAQIGTAFVSGYIPISLCVYNDNVYVGLARATTTNEARIYRINPIDETAWTLDLQCAADDYQVTDMASFGGLLYATTANGGAGTTGKLLQRSLLGAWVTHDPTINNAGSFESCAALGEYLYYTSRNYSAGTSTAVLRRTDGTTLSTVANTTATTGFGRLTVLGTKLFSVFGTGIRYAELGLSGTGAFTLATAPTTGIIVAFGSLIRNGAAAWSEPATTTVSHTTTVTNVTVADTSRLVKYAITRKSAWIHALAAATGYIGVGATYNNSGGASVSDATGNYYSLTSAVSGTVVNLRFNSPTTWLDHNPKFMIDLKTGTDLSSIRLWFGWIGAASQADSDTISTSGCCFRYSTVAGDAGWRGVNYDGVSQSLTAAIMAIAASTHYRLIVEVTGAGTLVTYTVENVDTGISASLTLATNIKTGTQHLGCATHVTQTGSTRFTYVKSIFIEWD